MMKLDKELRVALKATKLANEVIMKLYNNEYKTEIKEDDSPVTEADLKANDIIIKTLKEEFCRRIVTFIYKIRCNIFHGAKTLKELHNPLQKKRIDIYAVFMIAINQMVFSYIDYLNGIDITYEFDSLRKDLNDKNYD